MKKIKYYPFNNSVETGLRILILLNKSYPNHLDINKILYLDFLNVHYGDENNNIIPIHPKMKDVKGELIVRKLIIDKGLILLINKGLVEKKFKGEGIFYQISDIGSPFIDSLDSKYSNKLNVNAEFINKYFGNKNISELKKTIDLMIS